MAALNFGSTLLQTGAARLGGGEDDLGALRRALAREEEEEEKEGLSSGGGGDDDGNDGNDASTSPFDRAFAAHALTPKLAQALMVPEAERLRWAPRAALGDMLRHALAQEGEEEGSGGGSGNGGAAPSATGRHHHPRPLRAAELSLWFSCVDAERGGALVSLAEYRRGVAEMRARLAAGAGGRNLLLRALPPPPPALAAATKDNRARRTDVTRGAGEGTSMAAAFGELVARHARW